MCNTMRLDIKMAITTFYILTLLYGAQSTLNECTINATLSTTDLWHGYLFETTFQEDESTFSYQISYPANQCCVNLLIYFWDQIANITDNMTCEQREAIMSSGNNQIISLQPQNRLCVTTNETGTEQYMCVGKQTFRSARPRTWYGAISRCNSNNETLTIKFFFNITNVVGSCEFETTTQTSNVERGSVYSTVMLTACIILLTVL